MQSAHSWRVSAAHGAHVLLHDNVRELEAPARLEDTANLRERRDLVRHEVQDAIARDDVDA